MPAVTRIGDKDMRHCTTPTRAEGSPNVFVNGIGVSRQGDLNTNHHCPPHTSSHPFCSSHSAAISVGSQTVFVNKRGCGRVGDKIEGCTAVAQGSPNVFAGG